MIWQVGVLDQYRRQGIANELLLQLWASNPNERLWSACIDPDNTASMSLFSSFARERQGMMFENEAYRGELAGTPAELYNEKIFTLEFA